MQVHVGGIDIPFYIDAKNTDLLKKSADSNPPDTMRILAPLDNLLWDRKLIKMLFGFDYEWEVYTPARDRKFGYYVLPLTMGNEFIGRIEFEKTQNKVSVKHVWYEPNIRVDAALKKSQGDCVNRFMRYLKQGKQ